MTRFTRLLTAVLSLALVLGPGLDAATVTSNVATINLTLNAQESITVVPSTQSVPLTTADGHIYGNSGASITTTWNLAPGHSSLQVSAYFTGANAFDGGSSG